MGIVSLTSPLLLAGLSLLALPLLAHWLNRRSRRTLVFPSIALLQQTVSQQSQFHRLKRWLLLALRLIAVTCIVLAFTRPLWHSSIAGAAVAPGASVGVVLLVDTSASTSQQRAGVTELSALQAGAANALSSLHVGVDAAGLIVADGAPASVYPQLSENLTGLKSEVARLVPTNSRADFSAAFLAAGKLLASHSGPRRLYLFSDLQRSNWQEFLQSNSLGRGLPEGTLVTVFPREGMTDNVILSRPRQFPAVPVEGEPFDLTVQVTNASATARQLLVRCQRLAGDGSDEIVGRDEQTVTLTPQEQREVLFRVEAFNSEREFVRFEAMVDDGLSLDNTAWLVIESYARTPVLLLSDDDPTEPGTAVYYLQRALAPTAETPARFQPQVLKRSQLTATALQAAPVIVLCGIHALEAEQAQLLADHVRNGGGLVIYAGEEAVDRQLQTLASAGPMLPWLPGPRRFSTAREGRRIGSGRWQTTWLRPFDEQSQLALQQIHFPRVWSSGAIQPAAEVLLQFDDGTPAIGARAYDRGTVVLCNFSPDSTTSDLARHGAFVALTQLLVQGVLPALNEQSQPLVGQPLVFRTRLSSDEQALARLVSPKGTPPALVYRSADQGAVPLVQQVNHPGLYKLWVNGKLVEAVAVGIDEREGLLERLPPSEIEQKLKSSAGALVTVSTEPDGTLKPLRGEPMWGGFLAAAVVAIGLELFLLGWWRR